MRKIGLFPVTFLTLLLTVGLLYQAGWLAGKNTGPRHAEAQRSSRADLLTSEAAYRHRGGHHHHWRSLVMHH